MEKIYIAVGVANSSDGDMEMMMMQRFSVPPTIDVMSPDLLDAEQVMALPPFRRRDGTPGAKQRVYGWYRGGCLAVDGQRVRLPHVRIPGRGMVTSREAIEWFLRRLSGVEATGAASATPTLEPAAADAALDDAGY
jgi:hypothetical protein